METRIKSMSRLVQSSRGKLLCAVFPCKQAGKSKYIYSFLLMVSSNRTNGAVIEGWRIKVTKYTSNNPALPLVQQPALHGLSSPGRLRCFTLKAQQEMFLLQSPEFQGILKDSYVTAQEPGAGLQKSIAMLDEPPELRSVWRCPGGEKGHRGGRIPFHTQVPPTTARRANPLLPQCQAGLRQNEGGREVLRSLWGSYFYSRGEEQGVNCDLLLLQPNQPDVQIPMGLC